MDDKQRLDLSKMIKEYQTEETTDKIRSLKHSKRIRENVTTMMNLKHKYQRMEQTDNSRFRQLVTRHCSFLYDNYTNLFNKLFKNELDLNILWQFLSVLEKIEDGSIDQHEGSYMVGTILKKMYIDSALKHEEHIDKRDKKDKKKQQTKKAKKISWNEYKKLQEE